MTFKHLRLCWLSVIQSDRTVRWLLSRVAPEFLAILNNLGFTWLLWDGNPGPPRTGLASPPGVGESEPLEARWLRARCPLVPGGREQLQTPAHPRRLLLLHCVSGQAWEAPGRKQKICFCFSHSLCYTWQEKRAPTFHWKLLIKLVMRPKKQRTKSAGHYAWDEVFAEALYAARPSGRTLNEWTLEKLKMLVMWKRKNQEKTQQSRGEKKPTKGK